MKNDDEIRHALFKLMHDDRFKSFGLLNHKMGDGDTDESNMAELF